MKRFILKSLLAVALVLVALPAICIVRLAIHLQTKQYLFEVKPHQKVLAIGDSHIECSFLEDEQYGIKVFADSGCPYNVSLMRLKELESRGQLEGVQVLATSLGYPILCLGMNQIEKKQIALWNFFPYSMKYSSCFSLPATDIFLYMLDRISVLKQPRIAVQPRIGIEVASLGIDQKKFSNLTDQQKKEDLESGHKRLFGHEVPSAATLEKKKRDAIFFLKEIRKVCNRNKIEMVVFSSPQHPEFRKMVPDWADKFVSDLVGELTKDGFLYFNYMDLYKDENNDSLYLDPTHLSREGACKFTKIFHRDVLQKMLKESPQKQ